MRTGITLDVLRSLVICTLGPQSVCFVSVHLHGSNIPVFNILFFSGVGALTKIYGGRNRRGVRPSHFARAGSNVARKSLQSLEGINWIEKDANSGGRRLTSQGFRDLDRVAAQLKEAKKKKLIADALAAAAAAAAPPAAPAVAETPVQA